MAVSSTIGSLFFGSLGAWSPTFFVRYHDMSLSQAAGALILLALGGLAGALLSGWTADYMTYRGMRAGRIVVAAVARLAGFPLFFLTFTLGNTPLMLVCFAFAAMCLIAPQAPLNAARADVLHPRLRGRGHVARHRAAEQFERAGTGGRRHPVRSPTACARRS